MFEHLQQYSRILVTGPLRSGTTICSKMIAQDLDRTYVDENEWGATNEDSFALAINKKGVFQCPGMMRILQDLRMGDAITIVMARNETRIEESQALMPKKYIVESRSNYPNIGTSSLPFYQYWTWGSRNPWVWQNYRALQVHELWVPKEERVDWHLKQTTRDDR